MYSRLNISIGLTIGISALIAVFVFLGTIYFSNEEIIRRGFALSGLISLLTFSILYRILPSIKAMPDWSFSSFIILGGHLILTLSNMLFIAGIILMDEYFMGVIQFNVIVLASLYAVSTLTSFALLAIYSVKYEL